jgi:hypothetical protein
VEFSIPKKLCLLRLFKKASLLIKGNTMTHPYSIYIWQPPLSRSGKGHWIEQLQAYTEQYALYVANLIHRDSRAVIKVVRYGLNLACFPDEHAVELVERQIARQLEQQ